MSRTTLPGLKVVFCTRARTSKEAKISFEAVRLACPESKDEKHFLPLPLFVPIAGFDPADRCVGCGMSILRTNCTILTSFFRAVSLKVIPLNKK